MYTLVFSIFTTLRGAANTPYTIRHFSNNPILIRKVASYGGIITMAGSMIVSILFPIVMSKLATSAGGWRTTVAIFVLPLLLILCCVSSSARRIPAWTVVTSSSSRSV